ncbi:MAG TPA: FG-GAP repeat protein [Anaerolineaceae bacterium]|nr:FG-GAP repeat protein [Anaerolineaceae bacterium]
MLRTRFWMRLLIVIALVWTAQPMAGNVQAEATGIELDGGSGMEGILFQGKLFASLSGGDGFGFSVSYSDDGTTMLVGAYMADVGSLLDQGAAYVFTRSGSSWVQQAVLQASDGAAGDRFGVSVSLSGDGNTAAVGADKADVGAYADQGRMYIFTRPAGGITWTEKAALTVNIADAEARLGWSVALSENGNYALAGAFYADFAGDAHQGGGFVYVRSGETWNFQEVLTSGDAGDYLGYSVALNADGSVALLGAFNSLEGRGSAMAFYRNGTDWPSMRTLSVADGLAGDGFGRSVALNDAGNNALVGASKADVNGKVDQGAAYVFTYFEGAWYLVQKLLPNDGAAGDGFGVSVAFNNTGSIALVGAYLADVNSVENQGAAYSFSGSNGNYVQSGKYTASNGETEDKFGVAVDLTDSGLGVMGAYGDNVYESVDQGSAYFVSGSSFTLSEENYLLSLTQEVAHLGDAVALSDDGNYALVGAPFEDVNGNSNQGAAYLFVRNGNTWKQQARLVAEDGAAGDHFGQTVALDADGNWAMIGAPLAEVGANENQGAAYTYGRTLSSWRFNQKIVYATGAAHDHFGTAVALDDSGSKAMITAPDVGESRGQAYYYLRSGSAWSWNASMQSADIADHDLFGVSIAFNGDGTVAVIGATARLTNQGVAYLFTFSGGIWAQTKKFTAGDDAASYQYFGNSVAVSGDGNTVLVGAYFMDMMGQIDKGAAYVFKRSGTTWFEPSVLTAGQADGLFGSSVALSENGNTALVGAYGVSAGNGRTYRFIFENQDWALKSTLYAPDGAANDYFGTGVALNAAGDSILVGAPQADGSGMADCGAVYFFAINYTVFLPAVMR